MLRCWIFDGFLLSIIWGWRLYFRWFFRCRFSIFYAVSSFRWLFHFFFSIFFQFSSRILLLIIAFRRLFSIHFSFRFLAASSRFRFCLISFFDAFLLDFLRCRFSSFAASFGSFLMLWCRCRLIISRSFDFLLHYCFDAAFSFFADFLIAFLLDFLFPSSAELASHWFDWFKHFDAVAAMLPSFRLIISISISLFSRHFRLFRFFMIDIRCRLFFFFRWIFLSFRLFRFFLSIDFLSFLHSFRFFAFILFSFMPDWRLRWIFFFYWLLSILRRFFISSLIFTWWFIVIFRLFSSFSSFLSWCRLFFLIFDYCLCLPLFSCSSFSFLSLIIWWASDFVRWCIFFFFLSMFCFDFRWLFSCFDFLIDVADFSDWLMPLSFFDFHASRLSPFLPFFFFFFRFLSFSPAIFIFTFSMLFLMPVHFDDLVISFRLRFDWFFVASFLSHY